MDDGLQQVREAIKNGDQARARELLKPILRDQPSADAWVLAASLTSDQERAIAFLKKAIALDAWHKDANRLLLKLEGAKSLEERAREREGELPAPPLVIPPPNPRATKKKMAYQKQAERQRGWSRFGCLMVILLNLSCSFLSMSLIGLIPGMIGFVTEFSGGDAPVRELSGTPVEDVPNAAFVVPASQVQNAPSQGVDVIDHGYLHEYEFEALRGQEYWIYVQFMSVNAADVAGNVVLVNPNGQIPAPTVCERLSGDYALLGGQLNTSFQCLIDITGTWKVRVLGIAGESVGAYFIGVRSLDDLE